MYLFPFNVLFHHSVSQKGRVRACGILLSPAVGRGGSAAGRGLCHFSRGPRQQGAQVGGGDSPGEQYSWQYGWRYGWLTTMDMSRIYRSDASRVTRLGTSDPHSVLGKCVGQCAWTSNCKNEFSTIQGFLRFGCVWAFNCTDELASQEKLLSTCLLNVCDTLYILIWCKDYKEKLSELWTLACD